MDRNNFFFSKVPNIGLEYLVVILLVVSVTVIFTTSTNINGLITQLAVYAAVAFKMMPSINRLLNSLTGLKYGAPVINLIFNELNNKRINSFDSKNPQDSLNNKIKFENEIELNNINFKYEGTENYVLENITIKIFKNDFIGIIGESGSGKTTFLNIFLTLLQSSSGEYLVDKNKIKEENLNSWRKRISFVPQEPYLIDDTLLKNIAFGVDDNLIDVEKVKKCLETAQFNIKEKNLDVTIGEKGVQLSGGQKQRILIARALYNDPDIIVMDEPTSSLDADTEKKIIQSINKLSKNKTILLVSHRKSVLQKCNKIFEIKNKGMHLVNENN
jgi:ABC-type multidrug transport system fused ATPase/permease subunit